MPDARSLQDPSPGAVAEVVRVKLAEQEGFGARLEVRPVELGQGVPEPVRERDPAAPPALRGTLGTAPGARLVNDQGP